VRVRAGTGTRPGGAARPRRVFTGPMGEEQRDTPGGEGHGGTGHGAADGDSGGTGRGGPRAEPAPGRAPGDALGADGGADGGDGPGSRPEPGGGQSAFRSLLHAQRVWETELPSFDPATAPADPLTLFHRWFAEAVAAGQTEPHTMTLATAGEDLRPDVRTVMLHDADAAGWHFASHSTSAKGRQLAARPEAALGFYWPAQGRQIRLRGPVTAAGSAESRADLQARSTGALAAALTGRQSEPLGSLAELEAASRSAWERARTEPAAPVPTWTRYVLRPREVEFFQGDAERRHVRLRYRRAEGAAESAPGAAEWLRELLWP
jgi:pyridoxamine 5'-phosphate oxidase